ncbi:MAG: long-chain-fatty-acid--CoA ligase [Bacillota bacterium]
MLIADIPKRNARLYPNRIAVMENDQCFTHLQFNKRVNRLANAILGLGLDKGDRVAVLNHNCHQYIELYFACAKSGTPMVPLNYRLSGQEMAYIINDSEAKIIFVGKNYLPLLEKIKNDIACKLIICVEEDLPGTMGYEKLLKLSSESEPDMIICQEDIVIMGYTGGTTGLPKGVLTTNKNIISSCFNLVVEVEHNLDSIYLNVPPLFHAGDAMGMFAFSLVGGTNVVMNSFSPEEILRNIQKYRITHSLLVPAMILQLIQYPDIQKFDISSLKVLLYGTAPMPLEPLKKAMTLLKCGFLQVYGSTETFVPISVLKPKDHVVDGRDEDFMRMRSAGREVIGVQVKVVDSEGNEVGKGEVGEVIVKGNNVMKGYWRQPRLTDEVLKDGWYYTGDMGKTDELNYIYIVDRKKDMIISGGENIYPKEIEDILFKHPAVADVAVIGIPDEMWGESVKALIIKNQSANVSEEDLIDFCKQNLASYKKPKSIEFVDQLPRSAAGKVLKNVLREKYWHGRDRRV